MDLISHKTLTLIKDGRSLPGVYIMDDAASRFWGKYMLKTRSYNVLESARRWYVQHAEMFINAQFGHRLSTLTAHNIED